MSMELQKMKPIKEPTLHMKSLKKERNNDLLFTLVLEGLPFTANSVPELVKYKIY